MTKIVIYKEDRGYVADRLYASGSPIVGRGRSKGEALGNLLLLARVHSFFEIIEAKDQAGFWKLMRQENDKPNVFDELLKSPIELGPKAPKDLERRKHM